MYWSMDLHPDASLALGRMSPRSVFGRLHVLAKRLRLPPQADKVVVLGPVHGRPDRAEEACRPNGS